MENKVCLVLIHEAKFSNDEDYNRFLNTLSLLKEGNCCILYAYCLLPGCAYILLQEKQWTIKQCAEQFLPCCYHEDVEYEYEECTNIERFLDLFRHVCQIPVKVGVCDSPDEYPYGSWVKEYLGINANRLCSPAILVQRFGLNTLKKAVATPLSDDCRFPEYDPIDV